MAAQEATGWCAEPRACRLLPKSVEDPAEGLRMIRVSTQENMLNHFVLTFRLVFFNCQTENSSFVTCSTTHHLLNMFLFFVLLQCHGLSIEGFVLPSSTTREVRDPLNTFTHFL